MNHALLFWLNGLIGHSPGAFEFALALCGQLPLVLCVAAMLAWWWTDAADTRDRPVLGAPLTTLGRAVPESRCRAIALGVAVAAAFLVTRLVASAAGGTRPLGHETLQVPIDPVRWEGLVAGMTGFGAFPSDHAALYFAFAVGLFGWSRTAGVLATLCAVVFSVARVAVGFHYPSDIAAGAVIGAGAAGVAMAVTPRWLAALSGAAALFDRFPRVMYPLMFVAALDFTQHFRLLAGVVFATVYKLVGMANG